MGDVIQFPRQSGPAIRCIDPVSESLVLLRMAELRAGVTAADAKGDDLERLEAAVLDVIASVKGGIL